MASEQSTLVQTDEPSGSDGPECTYTYYRATCENHTAPARRPRDDVNHTQQIFTVTDATAEFIDTLTETLTPDECAACGGDIDTMLVSGEWPPEEPTPEDVLGVFRETEGALVLEAYPDDLDRRFYIGEIGGQYEVLDEHYQSFTEIEPATGVDDLPALVRNHPTTVTTVDDTPLEGAYESWQNFEGEVVYSQEDTDAGE